MNYPRSVNKKYIVPKDKFTEYLILAISLIIIIGVWVLILFKGRSYNEITTKNNTTSTGSGTDAYTLNNLSSVYAFEQCPIGECPTNIFTGEKRCPLSTLSPMLYNPAYEVCNPPGLCTDVRTPYAVKFDQSTNAQGICDFEGCRCINYFSTPYFTQVLFLVQGGDIYSSNPQLVDKWYFTQVPNSALGQGNNIPMRYEDALTQFPTISPTLLNNLTPKLCQDIYEKGDEVLPRDTIDCINRNPCAIGKMAYVLGYNQLFTNFDYYKDANSLPVACVPAILDNPVSDANPLDCQEGWAPVYNYINGKITCIRPPPI